MITTVTTKPKDGRFFTLGPDVAEEKILMVGSCRSNAYLNYFDRYNRMIGSRMKITFIEPNDFHWNEAGEWQDLDTALTRAEGDARLMQTLREATVFVHEHFVSFGMFNTDITQPNHIYRHGLNARVDISIPNYHDRFILFNDLMAFDQEFKARVEGEGGVPGEGTIELLRCMGHAAIKGFQGACLKSSIPEFAEHFAENWTKTRFFWNCNHVSRHFTMYVLRRMNEKFLHWDLNDEFWAGAETEDLFANPHTLLTEHDVAAHGITWSEI